MLGDIDPMYVLLALVVIMILVVGAVGVLMVLVLRSQHRMVQLLTAIQAHLSGIQDNTGKLRAVRPEDGYNSLSDDDG